MSQFDTVFIDIDTQRDFMDRDGALYVAGSEAIKPNLAALFDYAKANAIPVISSVDAHDPDDPEFADWPPHCVKGTRGAGQIPQTRLPSALQLESGAEPADPVGLLVRHRQLVIEKPVLDVFCGPPATTLFERLAADRFVVFGVATEYCVRYAVDGLLARGGHVELVTDAVRAVDPAAGERLLRQWQARGVKLVTTRDVLGAPAARRSRRSS
jgi:nicotinamidase/pyrazinamidase